MSTNIDIDNNKSNHPTDLSSSHYKKLEISEKIKELGFITFFAIDTRTNSIVIEFKNEQQQPKMKKVIGPADINNWSKFSDKVVKELVSPPIEIERPKAMLIKGNLDQEYDNIVDILLTKNYKNSNNNNSLSDLSGISDIYDHVNYNNNNNSINNNFLNGKQQFQQQNKPQEQQQGHQAEESQQQNNNDDNSGGKGSIDILEPISVKEAIRASEGPVLISGRISGLSNVYKVITKIEWKCVSVDCQNQGEE